MSTFTFVPVNPMQIPNLLQSVKQVYNLDTVPVIPPLPDNYNLGAMNIQYFAVNDSGSGNVNFPGLNMAFSADKEYYVADFTKSTVINSDDANIALGAAKYGVGFRLVLEIRRLDASTELELSQLAAKAELNQIEVMVSVELKGFAEDNFPDIPTGLIALQSLNIAQYAKIETLMSNVLEHFTDPANSNTYRPELLGVNLKKLYENDAEDIIRFGNYALWRIVKGSSLKEAFEMADEKGVIIDKELVKKVYAMIFQREEFILPDSENSDLGSRKPPMGEKSKARIWLKDFRNVSTYDAERTNQ